MNWFRSVLLTCVAVVLTACAAAPQNPQELSATHGFVQVVIPQFGPAAPLAVRSLADKSSFRLTALPEGDGTLYGAWLPPGQYKLDRWIESALGDSSVFEVRARHLTSLGTLVPVALGGREMALLPVLDAESDGLAMETAQRLRPHLVQAGALSWRSIELPKPFVIDPGYSGLGVVADLITRYEQHVNQTPLATRLRTSKTPGEMLGIAKEAAAPRAKEPALDDQGRLYFGAALGQVRVRTPAGQWSAMETGSLRAITAVEWHDGLLLVGDDGGRVRATRDQGRTWMALASLGRGTVVTDIDRVGRHWLVLTAAHHPFNNGMFRRLDRLSVHVAMRDDLSDLKQVWEGADKDTSLVAPNWNGVLGEATGNKRYLFPAFTNLMQLDLASLGVRQVPAPVRASAVHALPGGMVTAVLSMGAFSKLHVSADDGDTWVAHEAPGLIVDDVVFQAPGQGVAARWPMAVFKPQLAFETYDAAAKRWEPRDHAPVVCQTTLQDARKLPNLCVTGSGSILSRSDKGWQLEFSAE